MARHKRKKSGHKNRKRSTAGERNYKKSGLYAYNMKRKKQKHGSKKRHSKKRSTKKRGYGKHSILGYKSHAAKAHHKKVVAALRQGLIASLVAKGKPPAIAKRIVDRTMRAQQNAGKKTSAYWTKVHGQRAAERAQAYMESQYAKHHSYV
jgi:hypothetical protein